MKQVTTTLFFLSLLAVGCSRDAGKVRQDINASLEANKAALNIDQWELSENNPEIIFKKWQTDKLSSAAICDELNKKTPQELTLFEEEIKNADNAELLAPCKDKLVQVLEDYWSEERKKIPTAEFRPIDDPNNPSAITAEVKFPDNVQYRDVSNGYFGFKGDVAMKEVVLTFDDGPHEQYTDMILSTLRSMNVKVIFFEMGKNVLANPEVVRRQAAEGHMIGSHSVDHKCLAANEVCAKNNGKMLTYQEAIDEIKGGHQAVYDTIGWVAPFFRFPYGEATPELKKYLKDNSMGEFNWSIDSNDWREEFTPQQVVDNTLGQIDHLGRGIVLFHDIQRKTVELLPYFLHQLYFKGYSVVLLKSSNPADRFTSKIVNLHVPAL